MDTAAAVHAALGITFEFINIGGGIGIPYRQGQPAVDISEVSGVFLVDACLPSRPLGYARRSLGL